MMDNHGWDGVLRYVCTGCAGIISGVGSYRLRKYLLALDH